MKYQMGLIGLAVMGQNLALNLAGKGVPVAVYNRTADKVAALLEKGAELPLGGAASLEEFAGMLERPRRILLMVKAGEAVDSMLNQLAPLLDEGDILIDGGNSHYRDTQRREEQMADVGIRYLGLGVSGGEEGALRGPSLMAGGDALAYTTVAPLLKRMAAQAEDGTPCCAYFGGGGAGHFVKMVHNGIEYADMQLIAESYFYMKEALHLGEAEQAELFEKWNKGILSSYLIEITAAVLRRKDKDTGKALVNLILDKAAQKGTGQWTSQAALELGVPAPAITEAVFARYLSQLKEERVIAAQELPGTGTWGIGDGENAGRRLKEALFLSKLCCYAQGFALLQAARQAYGWEMDLAKVALVWRAGCIVRARILEDIAAVYQEQPDLKNLLLAPRFVTAFGRGQHEWRLLVSDAVERGLAVPVMGASLAYYDGYRRASSPANLLQAQRDYFGAHTYERVDRPGFFHTEW